MEKQTRSIQVQRSYVREIIFIVFDKKKVIVLVSALIFLPTLLFALLVPSVYKSSAKFSIVIPHQMDPLQKETYYDYKNLMMRYLQEQKEMIFSNRVMEKTIEKLFPGLSEKEAAKKVEEIRKELDVTPPAGGTFEESNVFLLSFMGGSPKFVAQVATTISHAYLEVFQEVAKAKTDYSFEFFTQQTEKLAGIMKEKEQVLRQYESDQALALIEILNLESGKTNIESGANVLLNQAYRKNHELQEELVGLRIAIDTLEKELRESKIPAVFPEMEVTGRAITAFKNKVAQLQIQLNEMKPQFSDQFVPLKQVEKELELNVKSLKDELQRTVQAQKMTARAIEGKLADLDTVIQRLEERIRSTAKEKANYEHLKQEFNLAKDAYASARNQLEQARLANSLNQQKQYVTLIDEPQEPTKPVKPNRILLITIGIVAGTLMGFAVGLLIDHFDHTIKNPEDIEYYLGIPTLGSISRMG